MESLSLSETPVLLAMMQFHLTDEYEVTYTAYLPPLNSFLLGTKGKIQSLSSSSLLQEVWSTNQQHQHHWKLVSISSPTPDLLKQNVHFNKIPRWSVCMLKIKKLDPEERRATPGESRWERWRGFYRLKDHMGKVLEVSKGQVCLKLGHEMGVG